MKCPRRASERPNGPACFSKITFGSVEFAVAVKDDNSILVHDGKNCGLDTVNVRDRRHIAVVVCWSRLPSMRGERGAWLHPKCCTLALGGSRVRGTAAAPYLHPPQSRTVVQGGAAVPSGIEERGAAHREKVQKVQRT
ncbi:hypothetical protein MTO96_038502 [Rhipicephalus appendiculatus]